jgi:thymidylate kinase
MHDSSNLSHPVAILIRGLPGSGKTYLSASLQAMFGAQHTVMLDPDAIDFESDEYKAHEAACRAEGVDEKLFAYRFLRAQAYQGIADHKIIIWNQPFTSAEIFGKMVGRLNDEAARCETALTVLVVEVEVDPATAWQRVEARRTTGGHGPSEETFARFVREYGTLAAQGYTVVTVHGDDDIATSTAAIRTVLDQAL